MDRTDIDKSTCKDKHELKDWIRGYDSIKINYISTFAWVDLAEPLDYFKQTITQETVGRADEVSRVKAEIKLELYEVEMQDELWSPFPSGVGQFFFLDTLEGGIEENSFKGDK